MLLKITTKTEGGAKVIRAGREEGSRINNDNDYAWVKGLSSHSWCFSFHEYCREVEQRRKSSYR